DAAPVATLWLAYVVAGAPAGVPTKVTPAPLESGAGAGAVRSTYPIGATGTDGRPLRWLMAYNRKRSPFAGAPESADAMYPLVSGSQTKVVPGEDAGAVAEGVGTRWCAVRGSLRRQREYRAGKSSASASATDPVALAGVKRGASTVKLSNSGVFVTALIACSWFKVVAGLASRAATGLGPVTGPPQAATASARAA